MSKRGSVRRGRHRRGQRKARLSPIAGSLFSSLRSGHRYDLLRHTVRGVPVRVEIVSVDHRNRTVTLRDARRNERTYDIAEFASWRPRFTTGGMLS